MEFRARRFQFTLNEFENYGQLADAIKAKVNFKAMISCKEVAPSTGHVHAHIYALFNQPVRWRQVCGEHVEICKGSHKQNIEYIAKNGEIIERVNIDEIRDTKMTAAEIMKLDFQEAKTTLSLGQYLQYNKCKFLEEPLMKEQMYKPNIKVYYIWGDSGIGKSKYVYDHIPDNEPCDRVTYYNGFYSGCYPNHKVCWYDDFRDSDMKPNEFIHFIDYYVNMMNVKGSWMYNRYELIFITSVQDPDSLYKNMTLEEPRKQWMRRLTIINLLDDASTQPLDSN